MANKMDFAFWYDFQFKHVAFNPTEFERDKTRVDRMIAQLDLFSDNHIIPGGSIMVDFQNYDKPAIYFYNIPLGLHKDIAEIIYNKSTI